MDELDPRLAQAHEPIAFEIDELRERYRLERDRRIRPDGNAQYHPTRGRFASFADDPWTGDEPPRDPISAHTQVLILGGGWGGLLVAARLAEAGIRDVRIVDIAGDFGGTWYWNRYPGAMCDVEAHIYLPLLEELGYAPRHRYSYGPELFEHARRIGRAYGLYEQALFKTKISSAEWDQARAVWKIETDRHDILTADFFVLASGRQSTPKLPSIPGLDEYEGHIFHSSRWDYAYTGGSPETSLTELGQRAVGVVGTGATALQVVPAVAAASRHLYVFQRTPSSVAPRDNFSTGPDHVADQSPGWQRRRRINFQQLCQFFSVAGNERPQVDDVDDGWTELSGRLHVDQDAVREVLRREPTVGEIAHLAEIADLQVMNDIRARVNEVVTDPLVAERLQPWYRWQCKRPGFHDDYLGTFNRSNVTLVDTSRDGIEKFTQRGVVVGHTEYKLDCLIMATGFEALMPYVDLIGFDPAGINGRKLSEHWNQGVRTLHGLATDSFPNFFLVGSNPQTAAAVNAVHLLDEQATHVAYIISAMVNRGSTSIVPNSSSVDRYVDEILEDPRTEALVHFYAECTPGYYNSEGQARNSEQLFLGARYADGPLAYYDLLAQWRAEGDLSGMIVS